jgi:hypothetical protein
MTTITLCPRKNGTVSPWLDSNNARVGGAETVWLGTATPADVDLAACMIGMQLHLNSFHEYAHEYPPGAQRAVPMRLGQEVQALLSCERRKEGRSRPRESGEGARGRTRRRHTGTSGTPSKAQNGSTVEDGKLGARVRSARANPTEGWRRVTCRGGCSSAPQDGPSHARRRIDARAKGRTWNATRTCSAAPRSTRRFIARTARLLIASGRGARRLDSGSPSRYPAPSHTTRS